MVRKSTIACFFTSGHTECNEMQGFFERINDKYIFVQKFPNKPKRNKSLGLMSEGLTGSALVAEMYRIIEKYREDFSEVNAIVFEDDLDDRFPERNSTEIATYKSEIKKNVCRRLGRDVPVFVFFASPEIEAWFLGDWENSFISEYRDKLFTTRLHLFIRDKIFDGDIGNPELFCFKGGQYLKLSDQIKEVAFSEVKQELVKQHPSKEYDGSLNIFYSKRTNGSNMMKRISPDQVSKCCNRIFRESFFELRNF